ncbi:D-erythronate dehydrogenase [Dactylosporangium sp. CA-092794]|uniref:D-erythronate dehydrogenase n=1 Tax=Dactylosporangium sp. CA-092794 TaxID=3239929 RepID=UPI003D8E98B2
MRALITGASGFLGARLARTLLSDCPELTGLVLADRVEPPPDLLADERAEFAGGDLAAGLARPVAGADVVFHLAAAVSAESERDFDLGMRSNLQATQGLLDAVRAAGRRPVFVFASSLAVYGGSGRFPLPGIVTDGTLPLPGSSYGTQKLICEYLVREYTRKGYLRGRTARLMTVTVRPGRPNQAASSFLSGIIREPLAGLPARCPVPPATTVAVSSPAATIAGLIRLAGIPDAEWGDRLALNLPALTVRVADMVAALERAAGKAAAGLIDWVPDPAVQAIVGGWPARFDPAAAASFGLAPEPDFDAIVAQYRRDAGR